MRLLSSSPVSSLKKIKKGRGKKALHKSYKIFLRGYIICYKKNWQCYAPSHSGLNLNAFKLPASLEMQQRSIELLLSYTVTLQNMPAPPREAYLFHCEVGFNLLPLISHKSHLSPQFLRFLPSTEIVPLFHSLHFQEMNLILLFSCPSFKSPQIIFIVFCPQCYFQWLLIQHHLGIPFKIRSFPDRSKNIK